MIGVLLLLLPLMVQGYTDGSINLLVRSSNTSDVHRYCIELATLPNGRFVNITTFGWRRPYLSSPSVNACNISDLNQSLPSSFSSNTILILYEHGCSMTEHSWNVEQLFGSQISLMIITSRTNTRYELTYNTTTMPVTIPVLIFWDQDFVKMSAKYDLNSAELSIDYPLDLPEKIPSSDFVNVSTVFLILLAGNFWAADEFKRKIKGKDTDTRRESSSSQIATVTSERPFASILTKRNSIAPSEISTRQTGPAVLPMTCCFILFIICFAVGWLLLLYFFPSVMVRILQVLFCITAFTSFTSCLRRMSYLAPILRRYQTSFYQFRKPCKCKLGPFNLFTFFAMSVSLTLVIIWYVYRLTDWAWILQNILGAAICTTVLSLYRLSNMRVITVILVLFFLYDIFFVFITPYIPIFQQSSDSSNTTASPSSPLIPTRKPSKNPSVMEQVALGLGGNGEAVPLLFASPLFIPESEIDPCVTQGKTMLGFGDVILPGILLTFCKIFDIASANRWPIYYTQSIISYFVGLSITHIALHFMGTAQPALLYLVPCLLISTIITSLCRRELKELYTGKRIQALLDGANAPETAVHNPVEQQITVESV